VSIIFKVPIIHGILFGPILAATDAAAVAAIYEISNTKKAKSDY
jgi:NhaP-type Na+/H+ and K+/H+ antiporter